VNYVCYSRPLKHNAFVRFWKCQWLTDKGDHGYQYIVSLRFFCQWDMGPTSSGVSFWTTLTPRSTILVINSQSLSLSKNYATIVDPGFSLPHSKLHPIKPSSEPHTRVNPVRTLSTYLFNFHVIILTVCNTRQFITLILCLTLSIVFPIFAIGRSYGRAV
jgi:hypothetical protein